MTIYQCRGLIRNIYSNDANMEGDIVGSLDNVLSKYKVKEITVEMPDYKAIIELDEKGTSQYTDIISEVSNVIREYIDRNIDSIKENKEEFIEFVNNNSSLLFDSYIVGNIIVINL